jgi:hypothetical protein
MFRTVSWAGGNLSWVSFYSQAYEGVKEIIRERTKLPDLAVAELAAYGGPGATTPLARHAQNHVILPHVERHIRDLLGSTTYTRLQKRVFASTNSL